MKLNYILVVLLAVIASCSNEEIVDNKVSKSQEEVLITATIGQKENESRVVFEQNDTTTTVNWTVSDVITLFAGEQNNLHYMAVNDDESSSALPTQFVATQEEVLKNVEGQHVYACFPTSLESVEKVSLLSTLTLDFEEKTRFDEETGEETIYTEDSYCPFLYGSGIIQEGKLSLRFKHLYAYIRLTVKDSDIPSDVTERTVKMISIKSSGNEPLGVVSGVFDLVTGQAEIVEGTSEITVYKTHDLSTGDLIVYIPVLPQTDTSTITISLLSYDNDGIGTTLLTKEKTTSGFEAGIQYNLNSLSE